MMCSTAFERTGAEAHITAITGLVNVFGGTCVRATLLYEP